MTGGYVETSLGQLHYRAAGHGAPVVLLASAGRSSRMYRTLVPLLTERFAVFAIDYPGFGESAPLAPGTSIEALAGVIAELIDRVCGEPAHVYGLHTGNKIATALAVGWPQNVRSVILSGQSHSLIPEQTERNEAIFKVVRWSVAPTPVVDEAFARVASWAATFRKLTDHWWDVAPFADGMDPATLSIARDRAIDELQCDGTKSLYDANFAYDLSRDLAKIPVPTLVLEVTTPEEDALIGRQAARLLGIIPDATMATLTEPGGQALTLEDRASSLAAIIRHFVNELPKLD